MRAIGVFVLIVAVLITGAFFLGEQQRARYVGANPFPRGTTHRGGFGYSEADLTKEIAREPDNPERYLERAQWYFSEGEHAKAHADLNTAIPLAKAPKYTSDTGLLIRIHEMRKEIFQKEGDYLGVVDAMEGIVAVDDAYDYTANNLAWLLATCPDAKVRNGKRAVELATIACDNTDWKDPTTIDTLAAAYAETGDFANAVKWQEKAHGLAPRNQRGEYDSRLRLYRAHKPYREDPGYL
ncbi:MAG TPA: hypothetical protein PLZ36_03225 [Armatimonadota bacterium]|nr:hypothetical protein [Armatimonadota bacterium]